MAKKPMGSRRNLESAENAVEAAKDAAQTFKQGADEWMDQYRHARTLVKLCASHVRELKKRYRYVEPKFKNQPFTYVNFGPGAYQDRRKR